MALEEHLKMTLEEQLKTLKDRLEKLTPISEEKEPIKEIIVGEMFIDDSEPCYEIEVNGIQFTLWYRTLGVGEFIYYKDSPTALVDVISSIRNYCDTLRDEIEELEDAIDDIEFRRNVLGK